jgi:hypothetical protein
MPPKKKKGATKPQKATFREKLLTFGEGLDGQAPTLRHRDGGP